MTLDELIAELVRIRDELDEKADPHADWVGNRTVYVGMSAGEVERVTIDEDGDPRLWIRR